MVYISRKSTGNMTPFEVFNFQKYPWKYDLLWRQKLQETGISNRFPAVSTFSDAFHPTSRAEKSPRPLIFSFYASFWVKRVSTPKLPQQNAFWVEFGPILHLHQHMGEGKREFPVEMRISTGNSSGKLGVPYWKSSGGNRPLSSWKCRPDPISDR